MRPMEWYVEVSENSLFKRMTSREETALEKASATGRSTVEYTWKFQSAEFAGDEVPLGRRYTLDLNAMTRANQETKKVRRLLRIPVSSCEPPSGKKKV